MKKYILSLFALLMFLMPITGLSASGLTDPGTVDGEKQSPLYRLFYKEHQISTNDSIAYEDSDGTEYSFNDIFSDGDVDLTEVTVYDSDKNIVESSEDYVIGEKLVTDDDDLALDYTAPITLTEDNIYYQSIDFSIEKNSDNFSSLKLFRPLNKQTDSLGKSSWIDSVFNEQSRTTFETNVNEDLITVRVDHIILVDMEQFETEPSLSSMDTYRDVYLTVEEGETYYYYTFDGGFISILWVAVLFSGSYLYIRKAEVEDTKQAMIQASIFFIIGLVLLRVIQTII